METAVDGGLASVFRLYDCTVNIVAMRSGELARYGNSVRICWGSSATLFGEALVAWTARGICSLQFIDSGYPATLAVKRIRKEWFSASIDENNDKAKKVLGNIFSTKGSNRIALNVRGTNFQVQRALLETPFGSTVGYQQIAKGLGRPNAQRAVGTAVGANPVSISMPCHRVL